ncbi:MAG: hypothetical protein ACI8QS_003817 [Planctomycetota bacterium]|jgi:hypothetical protein
MNENIYYVMHVLGIVLLTAYTFQAFANPDPSKKKGTLMMTGIFSVLVLVGGFGLKAKLEIEGFPGWMIAKIGIWLVVSALSGMAFKGPGLAGLFRLITIVLVGAAVYLVHTKPF